MRNIILLSIFTFGLNSVFADCAMSGMRFFPETKNIGLNSNFIIEGYAMSQNTINSFKKRPIYLESENGKLVELNLIEILKGQMELTQAVFCPVSELEPNTIYFLKYLKQTESEEREMIRYKNGKKEKVYWKTSNNKITDLPNSSLSLEFEKSEVMYYGCGPSANVIFNIENQETEVWYKTEVLELKTNKKAVFYLTSSKKKLYVGHGMCSGVFTFSRKGKYKVRFTPMSISMKSLKSTEWVSFESPFASAKNPFGF